MGMMTLVYESKSGWLVELTGKNAKFWKGEGLPDYEGPIAGLPHEVIAELLERQMIKADE